MNWNSNGSYLWGEGTLDVIGGIEKPLSESLALSDSFSLTVDFYITMSESVASDFEATEESLSDDAGYNYVFTRPTTDAESQVFTSYTTNPDPSTSYTSLTVATTVWS